jgi:DNA-binding MarR family transcriptional regulator
MSGPTWDMMLDLMLANANGRILSASDLATGAGVPLSSGLRMIASLEVMGLVKRSIDERDRRRTIVRLTDAGTERMASYFEKVGLALRSNRAG